MLQPQDLASCTVGPGQGVASACGTLKALAAFPVYRPPPELVWKEGQVRPRLVVSVHWKYC